MKEINPILFWSCLFFSISTPVFHLQAEEAEPKTIIVNAQISNTLSSTVNQKDAELALEMLLEKMSRSSKIYTVTNIIFPDTETAIREIKKGRADVLSIMSTDYLEIRDQIDMAPSSVPAYSDHPLDEYLLMVAKDANIKSLDQLKNKNIIIRKGHIGTIALMWLDTLLMELTLPESTGFFKSIRQVDNGSRAVLPVFFGQADACIVHRYTYDTVTELNPQISKELIVLHTSPALLATIACFHKSMSEKTKEFIINFADTLNSDMEGKQYLTIFRIKRIFRFKPEYLNNIERIYEKHKRLNNK